ncbi:UNKNOWN [Stylonychia lemnae]|uniref:Uncharacterized protein n=1 Tax=Stylonychia lemnae TaxID=5949 RepID=A0A078AVH9_STYLE|nr:UNKNOWN [Stylonychia lemnae]|eukprot:CDW86066.1 UNKNOWN [Stylonychia lemnae]
MKQSIIILSTLFFVLMLHVVHTNNQTLSDQQLRLLLKQIQKVESDIEYAKFILDQVIGEMRVKSIDEDTIREANRLLPNVSKQNQQRNQPINFSLNPQAQSLKDRQSGKPYKNIEPNVQFKTLYIHDDGTDRKNDERINEFDHIESPINDFTFINVMGFGHHKKNKKQIKSKKTKQSDKHIEKIKVEYGY